MPFNDLFNKEVSQTPQTNNMYEPDLHSSTSVSDSDEDRRMFNESDEQPAAENHVLDNSNEYRLNLLSWSNRLELESIDLKEKTFEFINEFKHLLNNSKILKDINENKQKCSTANIQQNNLQITDLRSLERNIINQLKFQFDNEFFNLQKLIKDFNLMNTPCKPKLESNQEKTQVSFDYAQLKRFMDDYLKSGLAQAFNEKIIQLSSSLEYSIMQHKEIKIPNFEATLNNLSNKISQIETKLSHISAISSNKPILEKLAVLEKLLNNREPNSNVCLSTTSIPDNTENSSPTKNLRTKTSSTLPKRNANTASSNRVTKKNQQTKKIKQEVKSIQSRTTLPLTRSQTTAVKSKSINVTPPKIKTEIENKDKMIVTPPNSQRYNMCSAITQQEQEPIVYIVDDNDEDKIYENQLLIMGICEDRGENNPNNHGRMLV